MPNRKRPKKLTLWCTDQERATILQRCDSTGAGNATDAVLAALSLAHDVGLSIPDPAHPDIWITKEGNNNGDTTT